MRVRSPNMYIPRVGYEVIINFLEGDPDCPIVIGSYFMNLAQWGFNVYGQFYQYMLGFLFYNLLHITFLS
jgi:hypothetical protein